MSEPKQSISAIVNTIGTETLAELLTATHPRVALDIPGALITIMHKPTGECTVLVQGSHEQHAVLNLSIV